MQLFLKLWNLFSNFPSFPIWLFQPFSSPPLTIQPITHRAPCLISTSDLAQWLGRSSNKYSDLILWTYLPLHEMSSAIRMPNPFVFLPHFQTQVVPVWTALHKASVPQRPLMLFRPLSFLAPFGSLFCRSLVHSPSLCQIFDLTSIGGLFLNTEPLGSKWHLHSMLFTSTSPVLVAYSSTQSL